MKKSLKKFCSVLLVGTMLLSLAGCGKQPEGAAKGQTDAEEGVKTETAAAESAKAEAALTDGTKGEITVWTKDAAIENYNKYLSEKLPDLKVNLVIMDDDTIRTKLKAVLSSGATPPDVILIEIGMWQEMMNLPLWQDLSAEPYQADALLSEQYDYIQELSKNKEGKLVGLTNQATPAGFYYRRSIAQKVFGTDDPADITKKLKDWPTIMETGKEVYEKAGVHLFPSIDDIVRIQSNTSPEPWISDGKFVINENVKSVFTIAKEASESNVAGKLDMWGPEWSDNLNTADESMGLFIATWLMAYNIKADAPDTKGDWGFAEMVAPQFYGGSFFAMPEGAKNKAQAFEYIKTVTGDHEFLNFFSEDIGDFSSNKVVNEELAKVKTEDEWWGGQNITQAFSDVAATANARAMYDYQGDAIYAVTEAVKEYIYNGKTLDEAIEVIKEIFAADVPSVEVVVE